MDVTGPSLIAAVFAGAASFVSPCVLPLLPGYVGLMSGYSMHELSSGRVSMPRVLWGTALFVLGFTAVFVVIFGAAASAISELLRGPTSTVVAGWIIIAMGAFIVVTALWAPRVLLPFLRERRLDMQAARRFGPVAPPLMGAAFAFGWTPCIGPFLGSAILLGSNSETMGEAMVVLSFYSLGLGVPFLVTALLLAKAFSVFAWVKRFVVPLTVASGVLLAAFGVLMVTGNVSVLSAWFSDLLIRLGLEDWAVS